MDAQSPVTHSVTVVKVVDGQEPEGPLYAFDLTCDDPTFSTVDPVSFNQFSPQVLTRDAALGDVECTITEPGDFGATSVAINCDVDSGSAVCVGEDTVQFLADEEGAVTFTIANTFPAAEPPPAGVVPAAPPFTS